MSKATIRVDLGRYKVIRLPLEKAIEVLRALGEERGYTSDLSEALRYLENFDAFYQTLRKRFRDYLAPLKDTRDMVMGRVTVDKVRLIVSERGKEAEIVFDRRVPLEELSEALRQAGYSDVEVREEA